MNPKSTNKILTGLQNWNLVAIWDGVGSVCHWTTRWSTSPPQNVGEMGEREGEGPTRSTRTMILATCDRQGTTHCSNHQVHLHQPSDCGHKWQSSERKPQWPIQQCRFLLYVQCERPRYNIHTATYNSDRSLLRHKTFQAILSGILMTFYLGKYTIFCISDDITCFCTRR